jgi:hypothetical protein
VPSSFELDTSVLDAGAAQDLDRFLGRHDFPRVVAVMDMRVEDRKLRSMRGHHEVEEHEGNAQHDDDLPGELGVFEA